MSELRFYFDEHISHAIAEGLQQSGIDVVTALDAGTTSWSDREHLDYATGAARVIFTFDSDFLKIARTSPMHGGIVFSAHQLSIGQAVRSLLFIAQSLSAEEMIGRIEFI